MAKEKGFNVLEHELVPDHEVISDEEAEEVLEEYDIKPSQLPKLDKKDPVAKEIDADPGDVVKITRDSETAGKSIAYRYVIR